MLKWIRRAAKRIEAHRRARRIRRRAERRAEVIEDLLNFMCGAGECLHEEQLTDAAIQAGMRRAVEDPEYHKAYHAQTKARVLARHIREVIRE